MKYSTFVALTATVSAHQSQQEIVLQTLVSELEEDIESLNFRDDAAERRANRIARREAAAAAAEGGIERLAGINKICIPVWSNDANYNHGVATSNDTFDFTYQIIANPDHDMTMTLGDEQVCSVSTTESASTQYQVNVLTMQQDCVLSQIDGVADSTMDVSYLGDEVSNIQVNGITYTPHDNNAEFSLTHRAFLQQDQIAINADAAWAYVWITNPSGDGSNFVWKNKAGNAWDLGAVKMDGKVVGLYSAEDVVVVSTDSDTDTVTQLVGPDGEVYTGYDFFSSVPTGNPTCHCKSATGPGGVTLCENSPFNGLTAGSCVSLTDANNNFCTWGAFFDADFATCEREVSML